MKPYSKRQQRICLCFIASRGRSVLLLKKKSEIALRRAKEKEYPTESKELNRNYEKNGEKDKKHNEDDDMN